MLTKDQKPAKIHGNSKKIIIDKITNMEKHVKDPRTSSWIRSNNMKCSKHILTTAPYFACDYTKDYIYIIDKIKNMEKHMEIPRNSSWIRSKTYKNTWNIQEMHHG